MAAPTPPVTQRLAEFVTGFRLSDLPAPTRDAARLAALDTIGVAYAATAHETGRMVREHARATSRAATEFRPAALIGGERVDALAAAFGNGALANAIDFDEGTHIAAVALPAALAGAQACGASGVAFLEAFVAAFEIGVRLKEAIDNRDNPAGPSARGFWHVGLIGPVASAAAGARLFGLDAEKTRMALALATCFCGGYRQQFGVMAKALHAGAAARAGLEATLLARSGMRADPDSLEAPLGLMRATSAPAQPRFDAALDKLGAHFVFAAAPAIKVFPVCTPIAPAIDAVLAMRAETRFEPEDIVRVELDWKRASMLRAEAPDVDAAPFCSPFLIAAALVHGHMGLDVVSETAIADERVAALGIRIFDRPGAQGVRIVLRDERILERWLGSVQRLKTPAQVEAKFRQCLAAAPSAPNADALLDALAKIESRADMGDFPI